MNSKQFMSYQICVTPRAFTILCS